MSRHRGEPLDHHTQIVCVSSEFTGGKLALNHELVAALKTLLIDHYRFAVSRALHEEFLPSSSTEYIVGGMEEKWSTPCLFKVITQKQRLFLTLMLRYFSYRTVRLGPIVEGMIGHDCQMQIVNSWTQIAMIHGNLRGEATRCPMKLVQVLLYSTLPWRWC